MPRTDRDRALLQVAIHLSEVAQDVRWTSRSLWAIDRVFFNLCEMVGEADRPAMARAWRRVHQEPDPVPARPRSRDSAPQRPAPTEGMADAMPF